MTCKLHNCEVLEGFGDSAPARNHATLPTPHRVIQFAKILSNEQRSSDLSVGFAFIRETLDLVFRPLPKLPCLMPSTIIRGSGYSFFQSTGQSSLPDRRFHPRPQLNLGPPVCPFTSCRRLHRTRLMRKGGTEQMGRTSDKCSPATPGRARARERGRAGGGWPWPWTTD